MDRYWLHETKYSIHIWNISNPDKWILIKGYLAGSDDSNTIQKNMQEIKSKYLSFKIE